MDAISYVWLQKLNLIHMKFSNSVTLAVFQVACGKKKVACMLEIYMCIYIFYLGV